MDFHSVLMCKLSCSVRVTSTTTIRVYIDSQLVLDGFELLRYLLCCVCFAVRCGCVCSSFASHAFSIAVRHQRFASQRPLTVRLNCQHIRIYRIYPVMYFVSVTRVREPIDVTEFVQLYIEVLNVKVTVF
jgi:hypothetical protein